MPTIALNRITKRYLGGTTSAVDDLDLTIDHGDFMCLLGPSGCGKTTTLRMIAGLEQPTAGSISVDDRVLDSVDRGVFVPPERRGMGMVFQSYALWPHMTIRQNTEYGLRLRKVARAERGRRADEVMAVMGIDRYADRYPSQLSGGQQQRVALARMLAVNPGVMLLDEPLSNLDSRLRLEMRAELKRIHHDFGSTIVFVTHDQWEAMTLATRIAVMFEGRTPTDRNTDRHLRPPPKPFRRRVPRQPSHQRRRDRRCRVRTPRGSRLRIRRGQDAGHRGRAGFGGVSSGVHPDRIPRRAPPPARD